MVGRVRYKAAQALGIMGPIAAGGPADVDRIDDGSRAKDDSSNRYDDVECGHDPSVAPSFMSQ